MHDKTITYSPFSSFVLRTPAFSVNVWHRWMQQMEHDDGLLQLLHDSQFMEALFVATPVLYEEVKKLKTNKLPEKEKNRVKYSVLRYLTRMSWRCTPFGLFSGCSLGFLDNSAKMTIPEQFGYKRHTRLDMNYLCALLQSVAQRKTVRETLKLYPNTSIYEVGDKIRYVEYHYEKTQRIHQIVSVDNSEYLQKILQEAAQGKTINDLSKHIVDDEITIDDAQSFIHTLIDNQVLVSDLEPTVTGEDILNSLINYLQSKNIEFELQIQLVKIQNLIFQIDHAYHANIDNYHRIIEIIKDIGVDYDVKYLFQVDMFKPSQYVSISREIADDILEVTAFLKKITPYQANKNLTDFAQAFNERYEDREIPLSIALDNEIGIGYLQNSQNDITPLPDQFILPPLRTHQQQIAWNQVQAIIQKKYIQSVAEKSYSIILNDDDFKDVELPSADLPPTFAAMCKVFSYNDHKKLFYLSSLGGSSAANLLGRFCHADSTIENYVREITEKENQLCKNLIVAEIVHLPESRIGNILFRPNLRSFEIPYLAQSSITSDFRIPVSDILVSVRGENIFLRSKSKNRFILPRLTNAHNYSFNAMPVYHFLCDMQTHLLQGGIGFMWNAIANEASFLPRICYKNVILSLAQWKVSAETLRVMMSNEDKTSLQQWRNEWQMPRYVVFPEGDNELLVDMECMFSIKAMLSAAKKRKLLILEEFPFDNNHAPVQNEKGDIYVNECIFGFYNKESKE